MLIAMVYLLNSKDLRFKVNNGLNSDMGTKMTTSCLYGQISQLKPGLRL